MQKNQSVQNCYLGDTISNGTNLYMLGTNMYFYSTNMYL